MRKIGIGPIHSKISKFGHKCGRSIKGGESADPGDSVVRSSEDERTEGNEGEEALSAEASAREEIEGADQFLQEVEVADGESSESGLDFVGSREELVEVGVLVEQQVSHAK